MEVQILSSRPTYLKFGFGKIYHFGKHTSTPTKKMFYYKCKPIFRCIHTRIAYLDQRAIQYTSSLIYTSPEE